MKTGLNVYGKKLKKERKSKTRYRPGTPQSMHRVFNEHLPQYKLRAFRTANIQLKPIPNKL